MAEAAMTAGSVGEPGRRTASGLPTYSWWAVVAGAAIIPCLYLHNLTVPFDFQDDGVLIYAVGGTDLIDWFSRVWHLVIGDLVGLGPFRPTYWFVLQTAAAAFGQAPALWRLLFFTWSIVSAASMILLMRELRIGLLAALCATALVIWNFRSGSIWIYIGHSENIAFAFTCLALICAVRAGRSARPIGWDVCGFLCALAALGTKNTFAAIVPAQLLLRAAPEGVDLLGGIAKHWTAILFLGSTLLLPVVHLFVFSTMAHGPTAYAMGLPTLHGVRTILNGYMQAMSLPFLAPALVVAAAALTDQTRRTAGTATIFASLGSAMRDVFDAQRAAFLAGGLLAAAGAAIYMPMNVGGGRYTVPGVIGLDIIWAAFLTSFFHLQPSRLKTAAALLLTAGMVVVAGGGWLYAERMGAQEKVYNDALNYVERTAAPHTSVAWAASPPEGQHFEWHLRAHGRGDIKLTAVGTKGDADALRPDKSTPLLLISTDPAPPARPESWSAPVVFERATWPGFQRYTIVLWAAKSSG